MAEREAASAWAAKKPPEANADALPEANVYTRSQGDIDRQEQLDVRDSLGERRVKQVRRHNATLN